ncbi:ejaculatory bulb-specific protein 3 [Harpegnathos saltator]|uniref:Ejaculatory bulb-specific protein 3 n=1 Tax=Harpegnathos saltator TaxID=610380 RepID=E2BRG2_HARSA|nr:ejaculatory bulb-specific protein 3 [Harpegnathos saltator]EFN81740.1 Ejaculatory bulb-specific protein 3 [Harpegnathos saltator]
MTTRLIGVYLVIIFGLMCVYAEEELYSDKYDNIDIDGILNNDRLRNQHRRCYIGLAPCITADMKFYKKFIGEAIATKCRRCTEKQKQNLNKLADWYVTNKPEEWNEFIAKMIEAQREKNRGR